MKLGTKKTPIDDLRAESQDMPVQESFSDPGPGTEEETESMAPDPQLAATIDYLESHRVMDPSRTEIAPDTFNVLVLILQELRLLSQHIIAVNKQLVPVLKDLQRK